MFCRIIILVLSICCKLGVNQDEDEDNLLREIQELLVHTEDLDDIINLLNETQDNLFNYEKEKEEAIEMTRFNKLEPKFKLSMERSKLKSKTQNNTFNYSTEKEDKIKILRVKESGGNFKPLKTRVNLIPERVQRLPEIPEKNKKVNINIYDNLNNPVVENYKNKENNISEISEIIKNLHMNNLNDTLNNPDVNTYRTKAQQNKKEDQSISWTMMKNYQDNTTSKMLNKHNHQTFIKGLPPLTEIVTKYNNKILPITEINTKKIDIENHSENRDDNIKELNMLRDNKKRIKEIITNFEKGTDITKRGNHKAKFNLITNRPRIKCKFIRKRTNNTPRKVHYVRVRKV